MAETARTKPQIPLVTARDWAERIKAELAPYCERIEIVGSVRRGKPFVGDLELLAVPLMMHDLLGQPVASRLDAKLADLVRADRLGPAVRAGEKWKTFPVPIGPANRAKLRFGPADEVRLDLFVVTDPSTWGVQMAVRTGPSSFSTALVTPRSRGGRLPDGLRISDGWRIYKAGGGRLHMPEEADFLALCGGWVEPEERR